MKDHGCCRQLVDGFAAGALAFLALLPPTTTVDAAEVREVRTTVSYGITYLPFMIMKQGKLYEKHATRMGLAGSEMKWVILSGGAAMNDALLSGNVDFAATGTAPAITAWARTRDNVQIKGVAGFAALPTYLVTTNPNVKSIKDFTDQDRIALPAVKVSIQAVTLQMAAAKAFGPGNFDKLDRLTVAMPHPEATAALLSGKAGITAHFSQPPFYNQQLRDPRVRKVLSAFDKEALGGPTTNGIVIATTAFHQKNPTVFKVFIAALEEATELIRSDKRRAAEIYLEESREKQTVDFYEKVLLAPDVLFTTTPLNVTTYSDFMYARGTIKIKPGSWKDLFFPEIHDRQGR